MSFVTCYNCGKNFPKVGLVAQVATGNAGSFICPDCVRVTKAGDAQAAHNEKMAKIAAVEAQATVAAAQAQAEAAERQARAAEQVAAAAQTQARAQLAQAVGQLDDEGLRRFKEQEQRDADKKATDEVLDQVAAAIACIENGGKSTEKINRPAYASDGDDISNANGVASAVAWHNLVFCQQQLTEAREKVNRIHHWSAPTSREINLERIEGSLRTAKELRTLKAKDAVGTVLQARTTMQGACVVLEGIAAGCAIFFFAGPGEVATALLGFVTLLVGAIAGLLSGSTSKGKLPTSWEEMKADAGTGVYSPMKILGPAAGLAVLFAAGGFVAVQVAGSAPDPRQLVRGSWVKDGHDLEVTDTAMRLDHGAQSVAFRPGLVRESNTVARFTDALLHEGMVSDDHCSGSLEVRGNTLVVIASGHEDCAGFSGNWARSTGASPTGSRAEAEDAERRAREEAQLSFAREKSGERTVRRGGAIAAR